MLQRKQLSLGQKGKDARQHHRDLSAGDCSRVCSQSASQSPQAHDELRLSFDPLLRAELSNGSLILNLPTSSITFGQRSQNAQDPVSSPELKLRIGRLVLRWVTTRESRLLNVLLFGW